MEMITELFRELWDVWVEMFEAIKEVLPGAFVFVIWVLCGIIILPCVYVSGVLYPLWTEWGDKM